MRHSLFLVGIVCGLPVAIALSPPLALAQSSRHLRTTCVGIEPLPGQPTQNSCCQQDQCLPWDRVFQPAEPQPLPPTVQPLPPEKPVRLSNPQDVNTVFGVGTPDALYQKRPKSEHKAAQDKTTQLAVQTGLNAILPPIERFATKNSPPELVRFMRKAYDGYNTVLGPRQLSSNIVFTPKLGVDPFGSASFRVGGEVRFSDL